MVAKHCCKVALLLLGNGVGQFVVSLAGCWWRLRTESRNFSRTRWRSFVWSERQGRIGQTRQLFPLSDI